MISPHTIQRDGQRDDVELFWKLSLFYHRKFGKLLNEKKKTQNYYIQSEIIELLNVKCIEKKKHE